MEKLGKRMLPEGMIRQERTKLLNDSMRNVVPSICIERAKIITNSYKKTEGMPCILQRAEALKDMLEQMTVFIDKEELVVGNHGSRPRAALIYPEFGTFDKKELDLMPVRKVDTLQISKNDKTVLLNEIYPYWKNRCTESISKHFIDQSIINVLKSPYRIFDPLSRTRSGYGHYLPNIETILKYGFIEIEKKAKTHLEMLSPTDNNLIEKTNFYKSVLTICSGIVSFQKRYAALAREMAEREGSKRRREELLLIAKNCDKVPYYPADNFYEALQSYWLTILIDYCSQNGSAISGGRFDQIFYPYYRQDIDNGIMVKEEAQEMLESLWVKHSDIIKAGTYSSARNNGGFATTINVVLGGVDRNGNDAVNELSYLCLDAEESVFNSEPNTSIRVSKKNPDAFMKRVLEILVNKEGGKLPFFNDDIIIDALVEDGVTLNDSKNYAIVGCVEPTPYGNTMGRTNACYFNLAKCLELALFDGVCQMSQKQMGPNTGRFEEFETFEQVTDAYRKQVKYFVAMMVNALNSIEKLHAEHAPHIYSSMLLDGCMERGKDCTNGGAKYDFVGVQGVGIADVGDSLMAIKKLVFDDRMIEKKHLLDALQSNFKGNQVLRHILLTKAPKYGNDIDEVDEMTAFVGENYCNTVNHYHNLSGGAYRAGLFCLSSNTPLGKQVGALPSGREAGTPLGDGGISPKHGMDCKGPTAAAKSVARVNHRLASNGVNFNLKFMPTILQTNAEKQDLIALIRAYFKMGAMHIQFNILTPEKLVDAQLNPDKHRSLVVRVAGYSAFFVELDKDIQDEIISRTMQCV